MFNSISWELFFATVISLTGAYYFITALLLYQSEIKHWLKFSTSNKAASEDHTGKVPAGQLMGETSGTHPPMDQSLQHASTKTATPEADQIIGSVSDLLQEVKAILSVITDNNLDKAKSQALIATLFLRYSTLKDTIHQHSISSYIADATSEEFPFTLTTEEVMTWWQ